MDSGWSPRAWRRKKEKRNPERLWHAKSTSSLSTLWKCRGIASQLFSIIWWFRAWKSYFFWCTIPDHPYHLTPGPPWLAWTTGTVWATWTTLTIMNTLTALTTTFFFAVPPWHSCNCFPFFLCLRHYFFSWFSITFCRCEQPLYLQCVKQCVPKKLTNRIFRAIDGGPELWATFGIQVLSDGLGHFGPLRLFGPCLGTFAVWATLYHFGPYVSCLSQSGSNSQRGPQWPKVAKVSEAAKVAQNGLRWPKMA